MSGPVPIPGGGPPVAPGPGEPAGYGSQPGLQGYSQTAEFFLSNYRLGKTLGIGSFGKVKVAEHVLTGHKVAIKILNRRKIQQMEMEEKVRREIKILRLFMHPHIIRLYEVIETPADIYVVMEYVKSGELFDYIVEKGRLMEEEARHFFQQIISGVEYCHRHMVVHRDLKPENLLLDAKMNVKIADFGLSNIMRDGHFLKTSCGSPNYAAPEVISGKLYAGPEVDVWSCGVILYALLCGSLPFDDENIPNLFKKIKGGIYNLPSHLSPGARDLIPRMLLVDPLKRITIPEIRQHPWFTLHLPRYLAVMQADTVLGAPRIDDEMVSEVCKLGFDRESLKEGLKTRAQNKATVTYYLMCDNRRKMPSSGYLSADMAEGSTGAAMQAAGMAVAPAHFGTVAAAGGAAAQQAAAASQSIPQQRVVAERKWRLGVHVRGHPSALMAELYRVLQLNNIQWKKMGPYNIKCRRVVKCGRMVRQATARMVDDIDEDVAERLEINDSQSTSTAVPMAVTMSSQSSITGAMGGGGGMAGSIGGGMGGGMGGGISVGGSIPPVGSMGIGMTAGLNMPCTTGGALAAAAAAAAASGGLQQQASSRNMDAPPGYAVVKFEAQMYKSKDDEYVIDIQRVDGELFLFMDTCGMILADLRTT